MKTSLTLALCCLLFQAAAQQPNIAEHHKQLVPLKSFVGRWHGVAKIMQPGGTTLTVNQEEFVGWELDSLLLRIEGIGKDPVSKKVNFHAFAIISFNPLTKQLALRSYTFEGRQVDAYFKVLSTDVFEWGFDTPGNRGKIKYTITFTDGKKWFEKGEFSPDGTQWSQFMTMDLTKKTD